MKKSTKLVILLLAVALIVSAFAFAISADVSVKVDYTNGEGATVTASSIEEAIENVVEGGTVTLKSRLPLSGSITVPKSVTIDLNGNTVIGATSAPVFNVTAGEEKTVAITGSGYIEAPCGVINHTTKANVAFLGTGYGIHMKATAPDVTAISVSDGVLMLNNAELVASATAPTAKFIAVSGGQLVAEQFGFVCASTGAGGAYAYSVSGSGIVMLNNCYANTTTSVFHVADGATGFDMENSGGDTVDAVLDSGSGSESGGGETGSGSESGGGETGAGGTETDPNPMPELTVREELTAFYDGVTHCSLYVMGGNYFQYLFGDKNTQAFFGFDTELVSGVKGSVVVANADLNFSSRFIDTAFGKGEMSEALYKDFVLAFVTCDIRYANYANNGCFIRGRAPAKFLGNTTVELGAAPFTPTSGETTYLGGEPLVYLEEGTRFDKDVAPVVIGEGEERVYETEYRNASYKAKLDALEGLDIIRTIDYESIARDTFTNKKSAVGGMGLSGPNRGGGLLTISHSDDNAYFEYRTPTSLDQIDPTDGFSYFIEDGNFYFTGPSYGYMSMNSGDQISAAEIGDKGALVTVREFNFASPDGSDYITFSFGNMNYTPANFGPTFEVKPGGAATRGTVLADGSWNKMVIVTYVTKNASNAQKIDFTSKFFLNPGTDYAAEHQSTRVGCDYINGELRISNTAAEVMPCGSGIRIDDMTYHRYSNVDKSTFAYENYLREGSALLAPEASIEAPIRVNGIAFSTLDAAFAYAAEINSYVSIYGDITNTQHIYETSADGYMVVMGDYEVAFDSEKAAKFIASPAGEGTTAYYFSNSVYGAGKPVSTNWYFGNQENILEDTENIKTSGAIVGTYPKAPAGVPKGVIIGNRNYTFKGWTADKYVWYGNYPTPAEYEAAVAGLQLGIRNISYQDLVYGFGPTYYPVYKDSGAPAYLITNPDKLPRGDVVPSLFAQYVANLGDGDTLTIMEDLTASVPASLVIEGTADAPVVVNIDLAGSTFTLSSTGSLIKLGSYVTLNIYSSVPGGKLNCFGSTGYIAEIQSGAENTTVNIGDANGFDGANLEINASGIALNAGAASSEVFAVGGIFNRAAISTDALFAWKNGAGTVTVEDAVIIATTGNSEFFYSSYDTVPSEFPGDSFVLRGSTVIPATTNDVVMELAQYSRLYVEDTVIAGRLGNVTSKVIVGAGTAYMKLSGANAIVGISGYSEENVANGIRSDKSVVYAEGGLKVANYKTVPDMFTFYNGSNFDNTVYTTKNALGKTVCVATAGTDLSSYNADIYITIPSISNKIVDVNARTLTVRWLTLEHNIDKYMSEEQYTEGAEYSYAGAALADYVVNPVVTRRHTGTWSVSEELSEGDLIVMVPDFILLTEVSGLYTSISFHESFNVNLFVPYVYYEQFNEATKAAITHAVKTVSDADYYYVTGLDAIADADKIEALLAAGATENSGEYLIPVSAYYTLAGELKALLAPKVENIEGEDYVVMSKAVATNMAVQKNAFTVTIINGVDEIDYTEEVSVAEYLKEAFAAELAKSDPDENTLKLLSYVVEYLKMAYKYFAIFSTADDPAYDFSQIADTSLYIESDDITVPDYVAPDNSQIAGILSVSVDLSSAPKFVLVANDPSFEGVVTIDGIRYTTADAKRVRGRLNYTFDALSLSEFDKSFTIEVDVDGDGTVDATGSYSLADYIVANEDSPAPLKRLLSAFRNYILYARKYIELQNGGSST